MKSNIHDFYIDSILLKTSVAVTVLMLPCSNAFIRLPLLLPIIYQFYLEKYQGLKKEVSRLETLT